MIGYNNEIKGSGRMYQQEIKQLLNQIAWIDDLTFYHSLRVGNLMAHYEKTGNRFWQP